VENPVGWCGSVSLQWKVNARTSLASWTKALHKAILKKEKLLWLNIVCPTFIKQHLSGGVAQKFLLGNGMYLFCECFLCAF